MVRGGPQRADGFESLIGEGLHLRERPQVDANAVKLLLYTSGTTGRPKGVLHSHNTGSCTLIRAMRHWGQRPGDTILMASPVTHITGFSYGMETPFVGGTCTVFMERWNAIEALDLIDRYQVSASMGATPFLQELIAGAEQHGSRLPSLRLYICGGAEVPPPLIRKAAQVFANCRPFRVYGSSETPLVTLGFVGDGQTDQAAETDGEVVHYEVEIRDDEGRVLPFGQDGEICARGPGMSLGYANAEQSAESFDARGFFATGDLGKLNADGAVTITGRKKDLINRGGEKVSAKEVEDILHQHPAIAEAAVVSMPHARLGETVCAYLILKPGASVDLDGVLASMAGAGVAKQKYPERLEIVESFPRTASGKVRKDQLRADIRQRLAAG
jgi:acyl-CoA synthetase (AMP-forming)/AMP-acid ligase II